MWILVFFDLPVSLKKERKAYRKFREFLLKDGFDMLQFSVYARVCNGDERAKKHLERVKNNVPPNGSIRAMQITDKQYERMFIVLGEKNKNIEKHGTDQLVLF